MSTTHENDASDEARIAANKAYRRLRSKRILGVSIVITGVVLLTLFTSTSLPYGPALTIIQPLLLVVAGLIFTRRHAVAAEQNDTTSTLWRRTLIPAVVMLVFALFIFGFIDVGRIVTSLIGEKNSTINLYGYDGANGFVSFAVLWAVIAIGIYSYIRLFVPIIYPNFTLRNGAWVACMLFAVMPNVIMAGMGATNNLT